MRYWKCKIHRCQKCPCIENVESFLRRMFCNGGEFEDGGSSDHKPAENEEEEASMMHETITFQQWTSTDCTDLVTQTSTAEGFLAVLCEKLDAITSHSFKAKSQASYLKNLKNEVKKMRLLFLETSQRTTGISTGISSNAHCIPWLYIIVVMKLQQ